MVTNRESNSLTDRNSERFEAAFHQLLTSISEQFGEAIMGMADSPLTEQDKQVMAARAAMYLVAALNDHEAQINGATTRFLKRGHQMARSSRL